MKLTKISVLLPARLSAALALILTGLVHHAALGHPYASGVTNSGGTIKFTLNENADSVKVAFDSGSVTNDLTSLGQTNKGVNSFNLGAHTNFAIIVAKVGTGTATQLSLDTNVLVNFLTPRGVVVNCNPKTANFGRVYVINSTPGTSGGRAVGRGLYVLGADQSDVLGRSNTASTAGVVFSSGSASSPFMPGIGPDDKVYVNDFSTAAATTWVFDPDITVSNLVLAGIGETVNPTVHTDSMNHPIVRGTLAGGDLQLWNVDGAYAPFNSMLRWDIGAGPLPWNSPPSAVLGNSGNPGSVDVTTDMDMYSDATRTNFYTLQNRSAGTDTDSIRVWDSTGTTLLWGSLTSLGSPDPLRLSRSLMISKDGRYLGIVHDDSHISILPLINGIPDFANLSTINIGPLTATGRSFAWDAADNVYEVSSGQTLLRVYSPGFTTTAITSNDSTGTNGTFQLITPKTTASVTASTSAIYESDLLPAVFTITRNTADNDYSAPLTVNFSLSGTATPSVDFTNSPLNLTTVVIQPGQTSTNITITPLDDSIPELTESIVLSLKGGAAYSTAAPASARIDLVDNETPQLRIVSLSTNLYEATPADYATLTLVRYGDTNQQVVLDLPNFAMGGTAISNVDYYLTNLPLTIDFGVVTQSVQLIYPIKSSTAVGSLSILLTNVATTGFTVTNNTAATTLTLEGVPPETILWSDNFENPDDGTNWVQAFATTANGVNPYDATVAFNYDYSQIQGGLGVGLLNFLPPAPHSTNGDTHGLFMTVNKNDSTAAAAALNLYPILTNYNPNLTNFGGNYALRFDMYLVQNSISGQSEYDIFGINHSGNQTNWFRNSLAGVDQGTIYDGLIFYMETDAAGAANVLPGDYVVASSPTVTNGTALGPRTLVGRFASTLTQVFKRPPYTASAAGVPVNLPTSSTPSWSEVEVSQLGGVVTLKINNTVILTYTNATAYTNGNIMLGYNDPYDSVGNGGANSGEASVIYDNVRVVRLSPPTIIGPTNVIAGVGTNVAFAVTVSTATGVTNFQWRFNGANIANATNRTYSFAVTAATANTTFGAYSVAVGDGAYATISSSATLTPPGPVILTQPVSRAAVVGSSPNFAVVARTFSGVTNYQWLTNSITIANRTNATLTVTNAQAVNFTPPSSYSVRVNDGFSSITSSVVQLTPAARPSISPPTLVSGSFRFSYSSEFGPNYVVDFKSAMSNATWVPIGTNAGTGGVINVTNTAGASQGYYRIRLQ